MKHSVPLCLLVLFSMSLVLSARAQQVDEEVVEEAGVQSRMVIASDDGSGAMPQIAVMSMSADGVAGDFVWGGSFEGMPAPDIFSLAQNNGVQKEIELVDEQLDQLKEINEEFSKRIQEQMKSMRAENGSFDIGRAKDLSEMIRKLNEEKNTRMQQVFLPHQFDRLRQISLQTQMRRSGETSMLSNQEVVEALGLTEEQTQNLKKKAKELKAEMEEKIKEMKDKAREELFEELTREQRDKLKSMLGNDFELKTPSMQERIQRVRNPNKQPPQK